MAKSGVQANFYLGVVAEVKENFQIKADIPGVILGVNAFPLRGDCDEPKVNDPIILLGLDPDFNSYYLYWKLKENDFTGFRAYGKEISIEEGKLVIRSYSGENSDDNEHEPGEEISRIELDDQGNVEISNSKQSSVKLTSSGNIEIRVMGGEISFKGAGTLNFGTLIGDGGPTGFLNVPVFPYPGTPVASSIISNGIQFIGGD